MDNSLVYFMRKGLMVYVNKSDSYIISYLLDKPYKETFYIEKNSIDKVISLLNKCHINYFMMMLLPLKIINILYILDMEFFLIE